MDTAPLHHNICSLLFCYAGLRIPTNQIRDATSRKVAGSGPDEVDFFFNLPKHSSRTMALGSTQLLTEMSTRYLPGGKRRPERKTDNIAIRELIV
jgi:hypothetical protein